MVLAIFSCEKVVAANLGDSRILLITEKCDIKFILSDHKTVFVEEIDRILSVGGKIVCRRVDGLLAFSSCLGDFFIRGISYELQVVMCEINEEDNRWFWCEILKNLKWSKEQSVFHQCQFIFAFTWFNLLFNQKRIRFKKWRFNIKNAIYYF